MEDTTTAMMKQTGPNEREVQLVTGNKIKLIRTDPFGLWHFEYERGPVPKELKGSFTKISLAERMLLKFLDGSKLKAGPAEKAPPVETKKVSMQAQEKATKLKEELSNAKRQVEAG